MANSVRKTGLVEEALRMLKMSKLWIVPTILLNMSFAQTKIDFQIRIVPTGGTSAAKGRSGDFGTSPFLGSPRARRCWPVHG